MAGRFLFILLPTKKVPARLIGVIIGRKFSEDDTNLEPRQRARRKARLGE